METTLNNTTESTINHAPDFERKVENVDKEEKGEGEVESAEKDSKQEVEPENITLPSGGGSEDEVDSIVGEGGQVMEKEAPLTKEEATTAGETTDGDDNLSTTDIVRTATPGSRTSTPPPGAPLYAPKKFTAVNATKKFLSKTAQPAAYASPGSKLALSGRPSASPVPISTTSRLLSTKLTTAPLAKSSSSSTPPALGSSSASTASPWAKPIIPAEADEQPEARRSLGNLAASMGQGQGIAAQKPLAWKSVVPEGRSPIGMAREFPTTREIAEGESRIGRQIAEGKMQAQMAAQATAAHNQALLQSLNAFTNVDSAHRWDDDDDDDVIDFGDDMGLPTAAHQAGYVPPVAVAPAAYVSTDDFDRSWPRKAPIETPARQDDPRDRVLFNANSNRLEPSAPRHAPPPAPTRLMSRGSDLPTKPIDRPLPPHLQAPTGSRALPPHMSGTQGEQRLPPPPSATSRPAWNTTREAERPQPSQAARDISPEKPPSRPTWGQHTSSHSTESTDRPKAAESQPIHPVVEKVDDQSAEMHTAAERARIRRLAEEADRNAAQERARQKAKELEERLNIKSGPTPTLVPAPTAPALLRRPVPPTAVASSPLESPTIEKEPSRQVESSWRARPTEEKPQIPSLLTRAKVDETLNEHAQAEPSMDANRAKPTRDLPPHTEVPETIVRLPGQAIALESENPKKENVFDDMLARVKAAMAEARIVPAPVIEAENFEPEIPKVTVPTSTDQPKPQHILPRPVSEFFNTTQIDPPRSPPPAWRTYNVRLPTKSIAKSPIPPSRLLQSSARLSHPQGWVFSFLPPIDIPSGTILADHLLYRPLSHRFSRPAESAIVSISPRRLEPFERKKKKVASPVKGPQPEMLQPPSTAETLISPTPYLWQQANASTYTAFPSWSATEETQVKKSRSPVKTSAAAKAEKDGFAQAAVTVGPIQRSRPTEIKPGVRFMVSSELEGDSLLDEVNKMSLETVGEGWGEEKELPKSSGTETPKTPPSLSTTSSRQPASPSGTSTPWSRTTQHDHIKSVWDQTAEPTSRSADPLPPSLLSVQSVQSQSAPSDTSAPMYPSLNAPSPSEAAPSLPSTNKSSSAPSSAFVRSPPAQGYGYAPSPTNSGDAYGLARTNGFPTTWSPAAFGASMTSPGYGYTGQTDPKAQPGGNYGFSQAAFTQQAYSQAYAQQLQLQQQHQRGVASAAYPYGYQQQAASPVAGRPVGSARFAVQSQTNGEYSQTQSAAYNSESGGYYGGIAPGQVHSPVYGQQQLPHGQYQNQHPQQSQTYSAGAVGQQIMRGGRKLW